MLPFNQDKPIGTDELINFTQSFLTEAAKKGKEGKAPAKPLDPKSKKGVKGDSKPGKLKEEVLTEDDAAAPAADAPSTDGVNLTHDQIVKALKAWITSNKSFVKALHKASEVAAADYPDDTERQNREFSDELWKLVKENLAKEVSSKPLAMLLLTLFRDIAKTEDIASHLGSLKEEKEGKTKKEETPEPEEKEETKEDEDKE